VGGVNWRVGAKRGREREFGVGGVIAAAAAVT